jgi:hypothetical protein
MKELPGDAVIVNIYNKKDTIDKLSSIVLLLSKIKPELFTSKKLYDEK